MININHILFVGIIASITTLISCKKENSQEPIVNEPTVIGTIPISDPSLVPFSNANTHLLDSIINNLLIGNPIPGIVVGVRSSTLGTYKKAFGVSNYVTKTPMNTNAIFGIGSCHKNWKWVILHILEKEGKLDLDDLVNKYISEPSLPGVTLRHLTQHSSGLANFEEFPDLIAAQQKSPTFEFTYDTMMYYLNHNSGTSPNRFGPYTNGRYDNFTIGVNSAYSSYNPLIACEVVKKITGKTMRQLIKEKIIIPLGLTATSHTGYDPNPALLTPGHATFTILSPFTPTAESTMAISSSAGGEIQTDVSDLLTFFHSEFTNTNFLPSQTIDDITTQNLRAIGQKIGLGVLQFDQWAPYNFWGHTGFGIRCHTTIMLHNKEHALSIVVFTNTYTPLDNNVTNFAIAEAIYKALY